MGEVEWDGHARNAIGCEPVVRQPEVRPEANPVSLELLVEFGDPTLEGCFVDGHPEIADPHIEQLVVWPTGPDPFLPPPTWF